MKARCSAVVAVIFLLAALPAWAQRPEADSATVRVSDPPQVTRVYEAKSRDASDLAGLLAGFNARLVPNNAFNTVTVTTSEANHAAIAELIRKFDVPQRMIDLQFYVVRASKGGKGLKDGVPPNIRKVIDELALLTRFDSFELLDSPVMRMVEARTAETFGKVRIKVGSPRVIAFDQKRQITVGDFSCSLVIHEQGVGARMNERISELRSSFTVADGETIVLGTSRLSGAGTDISNNDAIVTIVTAKLLK